MNHYYYHGTITTTVKTTSRTSRAAMTIIVGVDRFDVTKTTDSTAISGSDAQWNERSR
ncbi:hypothetical protein ACLB1O_31470 [Escherichia coli]